MNILGVVFITFYSVFVRRKLQQMAAVLDENEVSPSDYALLVRHVPVDWTKEKLEGVLEDHFKLYGLNVNYVNYCYDITEMVKLNKKMGELIKQKNLLKQLLKKGMKEKGLTKKSLLADPKQVPLPKIWKSLCKRKQLDICEIATDIDTT